jgi:nucleoside-diphosphate-sugar epimerase
MTKSPFAPSSTPIPPVIKDTQHLDELLSEPTSGVIETLARHEGDVIVLGAAGKMGPSLARMAQRATQLAGADRRIIAVSRFSTAGAEAAFRQHGVETIRCDLLQQGELDALPEAPNVVFMAGMKFGSTGNEPLTWAMNSYLPGMVCRKFRDSKIVAFGTGNVYPLSPLSLGGSAESDPVGPVGEYAMSCLGRERIFEHFSREWSIPLTILRLNYAIAIRYGVLVDVANRVWNEQPISLAMGVANVIWQGDANAMALQAFDHAASPPCVINVAGPEQISVRRIAAQFGALMGKTPCFEGEEAPNALLSNGQKGHRLFGYPRVGVEQMVQWIADWVARGGESLGRPTHFETRDGKF